MTKLGKFKTFTIEFVEKAVSICNKDFVNNINSAKSYTEIDNVLRKEAYLNKENIYLIYKMFVISDKI